MRKDNSYSGTTIKRCYTGRIASDVADAIKNAHKIFSLLTTKQ